jgi:A/G-specific adenine glycosylase
MHGKIAGPELSLTAELLRWYESNQRHLPWRASPGARPDPYRVWLSEIMLQQTTVRAVVPYFLKFVTRWPTLEALARAPLDDVLSAWAGLGYYARARNLHACANYLLARGGSFPSSAPELKELPGVGPYTAAAIAAIAFDASEAAIDGNVERVLARFYAIETPLPQAKRLIASHLQRLVPRVRAGDFAQALMDLGATICTPKSPNCLLCPWSPGCRGRKRGLAEALPRKAPKPERPLRHGIAFWIERQDGAVLLRRRPATGLLGGMMEIPSTHWGLSPPQEPVSAPLAAEWQRRAAMIEHGFTHFRLILEVWRAVKIESGELLRDGDYRWVSRDRLADEALPSVMRKIISAVGVDLKPAGPEAHFASVGELVAKGVTPVKGNFG